MTYMITTLLISEKNSGEIARELDVNPRQVSRAISHVVKGTAALSRKHKARPSVSSEAQFDKLNLMSSENFVCSSRECRFMTYLPGN